ncbi:MULTISPECIES: hypothetical protein [Pseudofrankia]|nr:MULTISPECIES: hypothetical protein [Pseudofrankia]
MAEDALTRSIPDARRAVSPRSGEIATSVDRLLTEFLDASQRR